MKGADGLLQKAAMRLDIPEDAFSRVPRVTVTGNSGVCVENHRGLLGYSEEQIEVGSGRIRVRIRGSGMELQCMTADALIVQGKIYAIEIEHGIGGAQ